MKDELKINMSGKDYIQYLKYKDAHNLKKYKNIKLFLNKNASAIIYLIIIIILCITLYSVITYTPYNATPVDWETIFKFLMISVGIGWILHGVGFSIIGKLS